MYLNRRSFVRVVPAFGAFVVSSPADVSAQAAAAVPSWPLPPPAPGAPADESFPSNHPFLTKEMVAVSHNNLDRVRELLRKHPSLAKSAWDWGFGDWETALGAASHVGIRARPIAEVLLEHGAPPTLFSAAMLGQLDIVKAWMAAVPDALHLRGPHGIPLIAHAEAGGPQAASVLEFLKSLGPQRPNQIEPLTPEDRAAIEGSYTFGDRARDQFLVDTVQNQLGVTRTGATRRNIFHLGKLEFYPAGAAQVRIRFERTQSQASSLAVFDPDLVVTARRRVSEP
jgi:hypothetical protein